MMLFVGSRRTVLLKTRYALHFSEFMFKRIPWGIGPSYKRQRPKYAINHYFLGNLWVIFDAPIRGGVRTIIVHGSTTVLVSQTKSSSSYFSVPEPSFNSKKNMIWPDGVMKFVKMMLMGRVYQANKVSKTKKEDFQPTEAK